MSEKTVESQCQSQKDRAKQAAKRKTILITEEVLNKEVRKCKRKYNISLANMKKTMAEASAAEEDLRSELRRELILNAIINAKRMIVHELTEKCKEDRTAEKQTSEALDKAEKAKTEFCIDRAYGVE